MTYTKEQLDHLQKYYPSLNDHRWQLTGFDCGYSRHKASIGTVQSGELNAPVEVSFAQGDNCGNFIVVVCSTGYPNKGKTIYGLGNHDSFDELAYEAMAKAQYYLDANHDTIMAVLQKFLEAHQLK